MPGSRANIDHLAVGPGGITVIDTKRLTGKVEVRGRGERAELRVGRRDRSKLLDGVARQVAAVSGAVDGIDVCGALCFIDTHGLPFFRRLEPRGFDAAFIQELAATLDRRFPQASREPTA